MLSLIYLNVLKELMAKRERDLSNSVIPEEEEGANDVQQETSINEDLR